MVFPGLKKLGKELDFKNNGTFIYGFIGNTYVMFGDGSNQKNVWFRFPVSVDEETKQKISEWNKKGYAKEIKFLEDNSFDVELTFVEYFKPYKVSKIKEVILDITDYVNKKYDGEKPKCTGENCTVSNNLEIFNVGKLPLPMCHDCIQRLQNKVDDSYEEFENEPNNYLQGSILAFIFALPGILLTFFFMILGRIAGISGFLYFFLAQKGYIRAKGKYNKIGVIIISAISFILTFVGTYLGYVGMILKNLLSYPEMKSIRFIELVKSAFEAVKIPELKNELFVNEKLALLICGICIVSSMIQAFRSTGKIKIRKAK